MTLNLDDYLDVPVTGLTDKTSQSIVQPTISQPTIIENNVPTSSVQTSKSVPFRERETYVGERKIVRNPKVDFGGEVLEGTIDPTTGKVKVIGKSQQTVKSNKIMKAVTDNVVDSLNNTSVSDVANGINDISLDDIDSAVNMALEVPEDPLEVSKAAALVEDKDKSTRNIRQRLVIKVERFLKTPSLTTRFNHAIVPDCYKDLGTEMLNEILAQIRDSIGRYGDSWGRGLLTVMPRLIVDGINMSSSIPFGIDKERYLNELDNDENYIAAVDEIDIDYFETSYKNPFIRLASSLVTDAITKTVPKEKPIQPQQVQTESADSIIAASGTSKTRRPIQD